MPLKGFFVVDRRGTTTVAVSVGWGGRTPIDQFVDVVTQVEHPREVAARHQQMRERQHFFSADDADLAAQPG